ncbi:hypothetical protein SAMN04515647_1601 [Cohaesibacter sp. ES.047]|uniref:hypothetical protein n=1 Tax=Cohaesibacter sp. ES.047 TaxID=1798205 RepID=UPI000BC0059A|nr:hypothetical protein [Cohaesibacter sp. ES.047]SNY91379.1 hypothetical protein SAMN04515647_1601 [Cohaesibacter sp. ES.047]
MTKAKISLFEIINYLAWVALVILVFVLYFACFMMIMSRAEAGEAPKIYPGPYIAYVTEVGVYDGDTINAEIHTAPGQILMTGLRVAGVDTPEIRRSGCRTDAMKADELALGQIAKAFVEKRYPVGMQFRVRDLQFDKYGGRHVGIVERETATGWQRLDDELLRVRPRIADPYGINKPGKDSLRKSKSWCEGQ